MSHKQKVHLAVGVLLAGGLLALVLRGVDWMQLMAAFRRAKPLYLLGLVATTILCYFIRSWRWGCLYRPLVRVPFIDLLSATFVGFLSGLVVPRAGEVLRPYVISRRHPVSTSGGFAIVVLERLIDLITMLALFGAYLYVLPMPAAQRGGTFLEGMKIAGRGTALVALAVLAVLIAFHLFANRAFAVADRVMAWLPARAARPFQHLLRSFHEGLAVLTAPVPLLLAIAGQSLALWLVIGAGFYFNDLAFGINLPFQSTFLLMAFLTVGVAIPTPGAVGGFHAFYLLALKEAFGVDYQTAAAAGIAAHALSNLPVLIGGLFFLGREGLTVGKVAEVAERAESDEDGKREATR